MRDDSQSLVSVIVPIYNVERYLEQCIESILGQSHENLEVLCVNDGSTDGSSAILERLAAADTRMRVINKENGGYGKACNRGLAEARGRWISIIEPDDWIDPDMYRDMLTLASQCDTEVDIVKTPWIDVFEWDDPATQHEAPSVLKGRLKTSARPFTLADEPVLIEAHPSIWSAIYRKDFLNDREIRFVEYPGAGWADNPFLIEAFCQAEAILYLDTPYYHYRCDLPGATLNHATDEAIARPFDRWIEMTRILERLGVTDEGILGAHYLRGFNYVQGAIFDDGWETPLVRERARQVFDLMDEDIMLRNHKISGKRKQFYYEVTGKQPKSAPKLARAGYLAKEAVHSVSVHGVKDLKDRASGLLFHKVKETHEETGE